MSFDDATLKLISTSIDNFISELHEIAQDCLDQKPYTQKQRMWICFQIGTKIADINNPEDDTDHV